MTDLAAAPTPERERILTRIRRLYALGKNQKHTPEGKSSLKEARRLRRLHHVRDEELETGVKFLHEAFSKRYAKMTFEVVAAMMDVTPTWQGRTAHIEGTDSATYDRIYAAFCEAWLWLEPRVEAIIQTERHRPLVVWESVHVGLVDQASALGMKPVKKEDPPSGPVAGTLSGPEAETPKQLSGDAGPTPPPPTPTASEPGASTGAADPLSTFSVSGYGLGAECPGLEALFPNRLETETPPAPPPPAPRAETFRPTPTHHGAPLRTPPSAWTDYRTPAPPVEDPTQFLSSMGAYFIEVKFAGIQPQTYGPGSLHEVLRRVIAVIGRRSTEDTWRVLKNGTPISTGRGAAELEAAVESLAKPPASASAELGYTLDLQYNAIGRTYSFGPGSLTEVNNLGSSAAQGRAIHSWTLRKNGAYFRSGYDASALNRFVAEQTRSSAAPASPPMPDAPPRPNGPESSSFWDRWNPFRR